MIYIDPPYNTGSDSFIYPDKFSESREEYARRVGDTDDAGYLKRDGVFQGAWRKNGKDSGHYHSNWLSMMLPRLHLAKTLLREDGVIFISIDDNEQAQLKLLCDEVFGAENFLGGVIWKNATDNNPTNIAIEHEFIVAYCKNRVSINSVWKSQLSDIKEKLVYTGHEILSNSSNLEEAKKAYQIWFKDNKHQLGKLDRYKYIDEQGVYTGSQSVHNPGKEGYRYDVIHPETGLPCKQPLMGYRFPKDTMDSLLKNNKILFGKDHNKIIELKVYAHEFSEKLSSVFDLDGRIGAYDLKELFELTQLFTNPKPVELLCHFFAFTANQNDLILDFFSGSGTTAHAVMQLNAEDGGSRRFICVQLPEETDEKSEARKAGFNTIAEIGKERIRRAGRQISDGLQDGSKIDTGFKVFKLAESGFKQWRQPAGTDAESLQGELLLNIDSVLSETSSENLLYELMLRMGLKLTCKVSLSDDVYFVEDEDTGGLYAFLLERVDQGLIDAVLEKHPVKVAVLDRLFEDDDALKSNTVLQMKDAGVMFECV
ncbi:site-specific DNA-methyltransferase [Neisseria sp. HMSC066H01]|uniref:site-specific DNA-methyltransferase n=1 Tax=Neisseria sp. HMSC066H01 TaxID=1715031 RepID=UPI0024B219B3|nr:site-specific DNA-methyltransferase [Neisseria sp. HMSC066H01]